MNEHDVHENENNTSDKESLGQQIFQVAFVLLLFGGIWLTIHSCKERRRERLQETSLTPSERIVDWRHWEHIIKPSEAIWKLINDSDPYFYFIDSFDELLSLFQDINRPVNIAWDGDTTALETHFISKMRIPLDLNIMRTGFFIEALEDNPALKKEFFEWVALCIQYNADPPYLYGEAPVFVTDAVIGRIVAHLNNYLDHDGLLKDSIYETQCISRGIEDWFDSPERIVEKDGAFYRIVHSIDNPYRHFEVYVYTLVKEYGIPTDSIRRWLDSCPLLINQDRTIAYDMVLPPPPTIVQETRFELEDGGIIWLSDIVAEWVVELNDALQNDFQDWDDFRYAITDLPFILHYYFSCAQNYEFDPERMADSVLYYLGNNPDLFKSLVDWIAPTVAEILKNLDPSKKAILNEGLSHLTLYLTNGGYDKDLLYFKTFPDDEWPNDYIVIDGQIGIGRNDPPFRSSEERLFYVMDYGFEKKLFLNLLNNAIFAMTNK